MLAVALAFNENCLDANCLRASEVSLTVANRPGPREIEIELRSSN
jgi:hypothetical protein